MKKDIYCIIGVMVFMTLCGRHWVWDKFDIHDPDLSEGHYEYDK